MDGDCGGKEGKSGRKSSSAEDMGAEERAEQPQGRRGRRESGGRRGQASLIGNSIILERDTGK